MANMAIRKNKKAGVGKSMYLNGWDKDNSFWLLQ
jgi:hypothetical protein